MRGEFVVYVDESGDHGLQSVDADFPVFVLAFCIFTIEDYVERVVPAVQRLKFKHFGHDMVVLHERDIRKARPPFDILLAAPRRARFIGELSEIVAHAPMTIVAAVIDKAEFIARRGRADNPYDVALEFGLERVFLELQAQGQVGKRTSIVFESRGRVEDRALELEFRRILDQSRLRGMSTTLEFTCATKGANSSGLQLADMVARPIGLRILRPQQANRAWDIIERKIRRGPDGRLERYGLKVYP